MRSEWAVITLPVRLISARFVATFVMSAAHIAPWARLHGLTREEIRRVVACAYPGPDVRDAADPPSIGCRRLSELCHGLEAEPRRGDTSHHVKVRNPPERGGPGERNGVGSAAGWPAHEATIDARSAAGVRKKIRAWADRVWSVLRLPIANQAATIRFTAG